MCVGWEVKPFGEMAMRSSVM